MKKTRSVIGTLALVLLFSSAFNPAVETGLKTGRQAPGLQWQDNGNQVELSALRGQYVLLNFWAGYDAASRMRNVRLSREADKEGYENLRFVSISFDTNSKVFEEIVKRDRLNTATQFHDKAGKASDIFDSYRLSRGFTSYLISPEGVIIAKDPSLEQLTKLIRQ